MFLLDDDDDDDEFEFEEEERLIDNRKNRLSNKTPSSSTPVKAFKAITPTTPTLAPTKITLPSPIKNHNATDSAPLSPPKTLSHKDTPSSHSHATPLYSIASPLQHSDLSFPQATSDTSSLASPTQPSTSLDDTEITPANPALKSSQTIVIEDDIESPQAIVVEDLKSSYSLPIPVDDIKSPQALVIDDNETSQSPPLNTTPSSQTKVILAEPVRAASAVGAQTIVEPTITVSIGLDDIGTGGDIGVDTAVDVDVGVGSSYADAGAGVDASVYTDSVDASVDASIDASVDASVDASLDDGVDDEYDMDLLEALARSKNEDKDSASSNPFLDLYDAHPELELERTSLSDRLSTQVRHVRSVSDEMVLECQELLALFGIPFITSPMEAEAQCGVLNLLGLVDGIVTDDSDVFLFGGETVYRKFFEQSSFIESYQMKEIQSQLGFDRNTLINLALLLGSDYTQGVKGVGIVFAVEILNEFGSLKAFKDWLLSGDEPNTPLQKKLSKMRTKIEFPKDFPSDLVVQAYLQPDVDPSDEKFSWSLPDLDAIRTFAQRKFGLPQDKVDFHLLPILKKMNEKKTSSQLKIDHIFHTQPSANTDESKSKYKSKRLDSAITKRVAGSSSSTVSSVSIFGAATLIAPNPKKRQKKAAGPSSKKRKG